MKIIAALILLLNIAVIFGNPICTYITANFTDFYAISIIVYIGYWFLFRSDYLYNSYVLVRHKNKKSYYKAFLTTEAKRASIYVTIYIVIALLSRAVAVHLYPNMPGEFPPISIGRTLLFGFTTVLNLLILRFAEQFISMLHKRITGNAFYISYVIYSMLSYRFTGLYYHNISLSILPQIFRQNQNAPEYILSYSIMFALLFILLQKLKKSSVRV